MLEAELLKNIPGDLKFHAKWCCWKYYNGTKIPFDAKTGSAAKSNDETTFCTYPELLHSYGMYDGIGIGLFNGFSAIDIDHCVENGKPSSLAQDIIDYCDSYTEISPSGKGIRIIIKTKKDFVYDKERYYIKNSDKGLEVYVNGSTNRFVTITGNTLDVSKDIKEVDLIPLLDKHMLRDSSLSAILRKDQKLNELWNSKAPGYGSNESEMDLALCSKLAYYLGYDKEQVRKQFEKSPYFKSKDEDHKKKWLREDYQKMTLDKATENVIERKPTATKALLEGTDTGNAVYFVTMFRDNIKFNVDNNGWMLWNGSYWEFDYKKNIRNYVTAMAEQMKMDIMNIEDEDIRKKVFMNIKHILNKSGKDSMLTEAASASDIATINDDYDRDPELLNCENGVINLRTGEIQEHSREQMISKSTHIPADFSKKPTRFLKFLDDMFEGNENIKNFMLKAFAYSLSNKADEQEMYILYGDGSNGKSMLLELIHDILGDYAVMSRPTLLTEQFNGNSSLGAIARLKGKRFVCCEELKVGERMDESIVKMLTSGYGNIIGKFLYANEFEFNFKGKIFMATNNKPLIRGTDKGIWRRINIIPFRKTFEGENADKNLKEKLMAEAPQILGLLIKYYKVYLKEGLEPPQEIAETTQEYRAEQDVVQRWLDDCCEFDESYYAKAGELYTNFNQWCKAMNEKDISGALFGRNLAKKFERKQLSSGKVYYGVRLKTGIDNIEREVKFERMKIDETI